MAKFKLGGWVEITSVKDTKWKYWNYQHDVLKGKVAEITRIEKSKDEGVMFYYLSDLDGNNNWFLDRHMILAHKQDRRFIEHMRKSCAKLQKHEKLCKNIQDGILEDIFLDKRTETIKEIDDDNDEFFDDWEGVDTVPIVPLSSNSINPTKTKIRKTLKRVVKQSKTNTKQNTNSSGSMDTSNIDPADWMTDDEIQDYLDDVYGIDWT